MRTRQPSIISDEQCSHATLMSIFHPRKTDRMLRVPSHPFPFIVHTHACMNSIMSGKSQSTRDVFLSPLCKWIWKGRKWTFSWHRYAGLIVPQMSVQVMRRGGGGKRFASTFLCCIIKHWATSHSPIFHKGHFTNNQPWALQCTLNHQRTLQGIKLLSLFSWVLYSTLESLDGMC